MKRSYATDLSLDAVFYVLKSGCPWRLLPRDFPPWETVYWWFARWRTDGTFERPNAQGIRSVLLHHKLLLSSCPVPERLLL